MDTVVQGVTTQVVTNVDYSNNVVVSATTTEYITNYVASSVLVESANSTLLLTGQLGPVNEHLCLRADGNYGDIHAIVLKPINPADTLNYTITLGWFDME